MVLLFVCCVVVVAVVNCCCGVAVMVVIFMVAVVCLNLGVLCLRSTHRSCIVFACALFPILELPC
jgi:hypothetical protein